MLQSLAKKEGWLAKREFEPLKNDKNRFPFRSVTLLLSQGYSGHRLDFQYMSMYKSNGQCNM